MWPLANRFADGHVGLLPETGYSLRSLRCAIANFFKLPLRLGAG